LFTHPESIMTDQKHQIDVGVETAYISEQSDPSQERFVFAYTVTISNHGNAPARLVNRHWVITDANGKVQEVRGPGVVGEQPYLKPGEMFRYTSGTVIETPIGSMEGDYEMVDDEGDHFLAAIEPFPLTGPQATLH
jgi:ApaG protein